MAKSDIAFFWQGEEVYRIELPANTTRVDFSNLDVKAYQDVSLPVPVVTSMACIPERSPDTTPPA